MDLYFVLKLPFIVLCHITHNMAKTWPVTFTLCLEVLREKRVEGSREKESSGEESRGEWLFSTLFGCF